MVLGIKAKGGSVRFDVQHVADRTLVLSMLRYEDSVIHSKQGRDVYEGIGKVVAATTLLAEKWIHGIVLSHFGFDASDESVDAYRTICAHYYHSPTHYDAEVMQAVTYFRANKCLYYTSAPIEIGDVLPDCELLELDGCTRTTVHAQIGLHTTGTNRFAHAFVAGFSTS